MTDAIVTGPGTVGYRPNWLARHGKLIAILALAITLLGVLTDLVAALGYRLGLVPLRISLLTLLPTGAYIAGAGALLCLIVAIFYIFLMKGTGRVVLISAIGLLVGAATFSIPYSVRQGAQGAPPIHDVSTDTDNPPQYIEALPLRESTHATNTTEYKLEAGRPPHVISVPEAQHKAFPDIRPIVLQGVAPADAFKRALDTVHKMKWHLIAAKPDEGRIEAWDQTFWFGFIDDVAIRITPIENGSKIDVRSVSRIGGGDAGTNAKRIRRYIAAFAKS